MGFTSPMPALTGPHTDNQPVHLIRQVHQYLGALANLRILIGHIRFASSWPMSTKCCRTEVEIEMTCKGQPNPSASFLHSQVLAVVPNPSIVMQWMPERLKAQDTKCLNHNQQSQGSNPIRRRAQQQRSYIQGVPQSLRQARTLDSKISSQRSLRSLSLRAQTAFHWGRRPLTPLEPAPKSLACRSRQVSIGKAGVSQTLPKTDDGGRHPRNHLGVKLKAPRFCQHLAVFSAIRLWPAKTRSVLDSPGPRKRRHRRPDIWLTGSESTAAGRAVYQQLGTG